MSSTTNSPSPSSEPIDISTPPPSESPPPLPCAPPMLLSHIQEGPSVLTLKERIGLSEEGAPALTLEQTMAIEAIVDAPLPILTREQIKECLAELVERGSSLPHTTDSSGCGPQPNDYDNPQFVPPHFTVKDDVNTPTLSTLIMTTESTYTIWVLEAAPVPDNVPTPVTIDDNDLSILHPHHFDFEPVNMALYAIDNHGLIADIDPYRGLEETCQILLEEQKAIDQKLSSWHNKWGTVQTRLVKAHTRTRLHPYLEDEIKIPHPGDNRPTHLHTPEFTITHASKLYRDEGVEWLPRPWYHYANASAAIPNTLFQPE
ncbi:hypothetical protein EI94DRAFT_1797075 [Lactarius quietus]|nr:hypothetical protein EI94DRAFT_1797075 [Lactarius quietus]